MRDSQTSQVFEVEYFEKVIFRVAGSYTTKITYISTLRMPAPEKYEVTWVMVPAIPDVNVGLSKLEPMEKKELEGIKSGFCKGETDTEQSRCHTQSSP